MSDPNKKRKQAGKNKLSAKFQKAAIFLRDIASIPAAVIYETRCAGARHRFEKKCKNEEEEKFRSIIENIVHHPAAGDISKLKKISSHFQPLYFSASKKNYADFQLAAMLDTYINQISATLQGALKSGAIEINKNGDVEKDGQVHPEFMVKLMQRDDASAAKAAMIWSWIYNLAASGQTPHLFHGILLDIQGGKIIPKSAAFQDNKKSWALDKAAAMCAKPSAPPAPPAP